MALNSDIAFKLGCGRYIQEREAIRKKLDTELKRFGKKVLFVCGVNGMKVAGHKIEEALRNSTIEYEMITFTSTPCLENADDLSRYAKEKGCDMVCGVGGGVKVIPIAFLIVKDGNVRMMPVSAPASSTADRVVDMVPDVLDKISAFLDSRTPKAE